jgi:ribonuclease HI
MYDPNAVKIYTDGSARPTNPGPGGIGLVIEFPDNLELKNIEISEGYFESTNNRMELMAMIKAFEWFISEGPIKKLSRLIIITDSEYVFNNYKNINYWRNSEWKDRYGKPYENKDLWEKFLKIEQRTKSQPEIRWEKGKTRPILDRVDKLAKEGSGHPKKKDSGFQSGKFTSTRSRSKKGATLYPANNQEEIIRVYRKNIYGKNENELYKITFDLYDINEKIYKEKYVAYSWKSCITLKRNNCYKIQFNDNPKMPMLVIVKPIDYIK